MDDPLVAQLKALVVPILAERQMELVELTCRPVSGQLQVRLLVDRAGGVNLHHCAQVNRRMSEALEGLPLIEGRYTVEVSSPGLDRPLVSQRDFERAIGEDLQVLVALDERQAQERHGMLLAVQPNAIVLKTTGGNMTVPMAQIRSAKKAVRW